MIDDEGDSAGENFTGATVGESLGDFKRENHRLMAFPCLAIIRSQQGTLVSESSPV